MTRRLAECGTESGFRRHLARNEVTCRPCCDAHAVAVASWRARTAKSRPHDNPIHYQIARLGVEPAEALTTADRSQLVRELHGLGWTDRDIAGHTRMTEFVTGRIRDRLGLSSNPASTPFARAA